MIGTDYEDRFNSASVTEIVFKLQDRVYYSRAINSEKYYNQQVEIHWPLNYSANFCLSLKLCFGQPTRACTTGNRENE